MIKEKLPNQDLKKNKENWLLYSLNILMPLEVYIPFILSLYPNYADVEACICQTQSVHQKFQGIWLSVVFMVE